MTDDLAAALPLAVGDYIGPYRLTGILGVGGMGVVYRAEAPSGLTVAIKTLRADLGDDAAESSSLFLREVRLAARLIHPNLVRALDFGVFEGATCLVMEYVDGITLTEWAQHAEHGADVFGVLDDILAALGYAHARGVVHRDLKPENILVYTSPQGRPSARLMDFGVAHVRRSFEGATDNESGAAGTPEYMAPEQGSLGGAITPASDLYSFGVLLYEILSGELPFKGDEAAQLLMAHLRTPPPPLRLRPGFYGSEGWQDLVSALMEKSPEERPATAGEVRDLLGELSLRIGEETFAGNWGRDNERHQRDAIDIKGWTAAERTRLLGMRHHGLVPLSEPTFVGRDSELARMRAVAEEVRARGGTQVILIEGATGTGKSRLLREFREELERDAQFAVWSGEELAAGGGSESGVRAALRDGLGLSRGATTLDVARLKRRLEKVYALPERYQQIITDIVHLRGLPSDVMDFGRQESVRHLALDVLLNAAAKKRPVCFFVDSVQHGDGFVFRLYQRLLSLPTPDSPRVLVAAYEPHSVGRAFGSAWRALRSGRDSAQVTIIDLEPMTPVQIRDVLLGAADVGVEVAEWLARETHGDLSMAFELLIELTVDGIEDIHEVEERFGDALVPVAVHRFRSRLRELIRSAGVADSSAEVWEQMAFFGQLVAEEDIEAVGIFDAETITRAIEDGLRTHVLQDEPPSLLKFRQAHHVAALRAIAEEEGRLEERYKAVADVRSKRSTLGGELDALQAARDYRSAGAWLEAAAQFEVTANALDAAGRYRASTQAWRELAELSGHSALSSTGAAPRSWRGLSRSALRAGELELAHEAALRSLELDDLSEEGRAESFWVCAEVQRERGELDDALISSTAAWSIYERLSDQAGMARVALGRGLIAWRGGAVAAAEQWLRRALQIWTDLEDPAGEAATYLSLARVGMLTGAIEESRAWIDKALYRFKHLRDTLGEEHGRLLDARLSLIEGKAREVVDQLLDIYSVFSSLHIGHLAAEALLARGQACLELEHWADAEDALHTCAEEFAEIGDTASEAVALLGLAICAAVDGRWQYAESLITEAMRKDAGALSVDISLLEFVERLARLLLDSGRSELALALANQVVERAERVAVGSRLLDRVGQLHSFIQLAVQQDGGG